jgi:hypothetical protein
VASRPQSSLSAASSSWFSYPDDSEDLTEEQIVSTLCSATQAHELGEFFGVRRHDGRVFNAANGFRRWGARPTCRIDESLRRTQTRFDAEPLHDREAGAVRKTESLVRILTEDGPSPFFVSGSDPNDRRRGLVQQSEPELQGRFVSESHAKEGDGFVNHHIAGNEEPIRGLHVPESLMMQAIGLIRKSKECRGINEDRHTERMGRQVQGFSCK